LTPLGHGFDAQRYQIHEQVAHYPHPRLSAFHLFIDINSYFSLLLLIISLFFIFLSENNLGKMRQEA
jgi:hypothetical protein